MNRYCVIMVRVEVRPSQYRWVMDPFQSFPHPDKDKNTVVRMQERMAALHVAFETISFRKDFGLPEGRVDAIIPTTVEYPLF